MSNINNLVTIEVIEKYLSLTEQARKKATPLYSKEEPEYQQIISLFQMADDYYNDAKHFRDIGDYVRAFGAINYAHAWIDAGVKLRLLDGHDDDHLFTLP